MEKIILILRIIVALVLLQTLFYKFTAHPDSIHIFSTVGLEPFGRIGIAFVELIAAILILIPKTAWLGAGIALGIIMGAVMMHLTILGIVVNDDGGKLFFLAMIVLVGSAFILFTERESIPIISKYIKASK